ncbi:MAG: hypothetical protein ACRESS_00170 [Stenotrophobium sp.]
MKKNILVSIVMVALSQVTFADTAASSSANTFDKIMHSGIHAKKKTYGPDVLKPEALKNCLLLGQHIDALKTEASSEKTAVEAEALGITKQDASLAKDADALKTNGNSVKAMQESLQQQKAAMETESQQPASDRVSRFDSDYDDRPSKNDAFNKNVAAFNLASAEYNDKIKDFNQNLAAHKDIVVKHNDAVNALNAKIKNLEEMDDNFNNQCAGYKFYADDLDKIRAVVSKDPVQTP